ncbi:MAG: hypothetical protein E1N59_591 [Puniceicoccaceae bacterium 5H]|nr:MAG: hypothetical protein E1N59_591 [Puniceicoccaceae bacterium 5H]
MMKTLNLFALSGFTLLIFAGCGPRPESTAEDFLKSFIEGNEEDALALSDGQAHQLVEMAFAFGAADELDESNFKFKHLRTEREGDQAVVYFADQDGSEAHVGLTKIKGEWKVTEIPKE